MKHGRNKGRSGGKRAEPGTEMARPHGDLFGRHLPPKAERSRAPTPTPVAARRAPPPPRSPDPGRVRPAPARAARASSVRQGRRGARSGSRTIFGRDSPVIRQCAHRATSEGEGTPLQRRDKETGPSACGFGNWWRWGREACGGRLAAVQRGAGVGACIPGADWRRRRGWGEGGRSLAGRPQTSEALLCVGFWDRMQPRILEGVQAGLPECRRRLKKIIINP